MGEYGVCVCGVCVCACVCVRACVCTCVCACLYVLCLCVCELRIFGYVPFILCRSDLAYFDGLNEVILAVGLVVPRKGVFQDHIVYLLVLTTPVDIVILGVSFSGQSEISLTSFFIPQIPHSSSALCVCASVRPCVCVFTWVCACVHPCVGACVHASVRVCVCVCASPCEGILPSPQSLHGRIHMYMHTR